MPILSLLFHSRQLRESLEAARPALYRTAYAWCRDATLADDLVQEATTKALERGDQLRDPARLKSWLFSILSRCWHDHSAGAPSSRGYRRAGRRTPFGRQHAHPKNSSAARPCCAYAPPWPACRWASARH
jgi:DNA-directed RNA polymerase specialized sigma24 family protein